METLGNPIDLVSPVLYDDFGREQFKYLPFAATNNDGALNSTLFSSNNLLCNNNLVHKTKLLLQNKL
jgi:hypothetical protein